MYEFAEAEDIRTPALVVYPALVDGNIAATLRLLDGDADRWRPHVKTAKLAFTVKRLVARGVRQVKCATTLELLTACEAGVDDALLAYAVAAPHAARVREIAISFPGTRVSAIVDDASQLTAWRGSPVGLFIDIDVGMHRTGMDVGDVPRILAVARAVAANGIEFRGLHGYDGHASGLPADSAEATIHRGYDALLAAASSIRAAGIEVGEVITAGTPAFPRALSYRGFTAAGLTHRVSPGTLVYCDATALHELPASAGYQPAAVVLTTVVSRPRPDRVTCDAGHKTVSADAGVPTCAVAGRADLRPARPSEEHLPIDVPEGARAPGLGERLFLVPRHVCPTVNNFDHALIVEQGHLVGVERVTARGREVPVASEQ